MPLLTPSTFCLPASHYRVQFNYLFATSALLVKMKRKELELKAREAAAAAKKAGGKKASGSQAAAAATPEPKKAK